ncbi:MAG: Crp/Fnr family transcriptional regulator [Acetobacteraceae bacterium]|nr:Crp/Fnr family transcriptional regulator [Acetobacteraceae bacterium]
MTLDIGRVPEERIMGLLSRNSLLRQVPDAEIKSLVRRARLQRFREREAIFSQGDEGRSVQAVLEGFVKLSSSTAAGREIILDVAGPGSIFGEIAVMNEWPRAADAVALTPCSLLAIDGYSFRQALTRAPAALFGVIRMVSERLRRATEQLTDGVDLPASARLAKALMQLAALNSHQVADGLQIDVVLSQRELGGMTGLTRESINKHLAAWREEGWVRLTTDGAIILVNPQGLRDLLRTQGL